ncbi:MAG: HD domain-containing protein [Thaumarchaeota archaeon]|nr:HD domain-containing protein [Nitrososphaerota archaeon]
MDIPRLDLPRVIGDAVHGQIPLSELEYDLLQLPTMNRLHYIKQTATAYLTFPSSVTTRFAHVVGALYMGNIIIEQLLHTLDKKEYRKLFKSLPISFIIKSVRLACLFHDVGHGPFSHSAEPVMYKITKSKHGEIDQAKKLFNWKTDQKESDLPIHEYFSYKLITNGEIKDTIINHEDGGKDLVESVSSLLVKSNNLKFLKKYPEGYSVLRKIVSSQLDADRMDYLLRDSWMSGVKFGQTDVNRIINNMTIKKNKSGSYEIVIHARALGSVEDMLDARLKMYKWFYQHHTVTATNTLIEDAIELLIKRKRSLSKLFHWSSYATGDSTDENILSTLLSLVKKDKDFRKFKGLIDRRYMPVSIFKQPHDYKTLIDQIKKFTGIEETDDSLRERLRKFWNTPCPKKLMDVIIKKKGIPKNLYLLSKNLPRSSPYKRLSATDSIIFYTKNDKKLRELTTISPYSVKINDEWVKFPSLFVFYVIPNVQKHEAEEYKPFIVESIAKAIASK